MMAQVPSAVCAQIVVVRSSLAKCRRRFRISIFILFFFGVRLHTEFADCTMIKQANAGCGCIADSVLLVFRREIPSICGITRNHFELVFGMIWYLCALHVLSISFWTAQQWDGRRIVDCAGARYISVSEANVKGFRSFHWRSGCVRAQE